MNAPKAKTGLIGRLIDFVSTHGGTLYMVDVITNMFSSGTKHSPGSDKQRNKYEKMRDEAVWASTLQEAVEYLVKTLGINRRHAEIKVNNLLEFLERYPYYMDSIRETLTIMEDKESRIKFCLKLISLKQEEFQAFLGTMDERSVVAKAIQGYFTAAENWRKTLINMPDDLLKKLIGLESYLEAEKKSPDFDVLCLRLGYINSDKERLETLQNILSEESPELQYKKANRIGLIRYVVGEKAVREFTHFIENIISGKHFARSPEEKEKISEDLAKAKEDYRKSLEKFKNSFRLW